MKTQRVGMIGWMILLAALPGLAVDNATPAPYLGQEPPGFVPKVFAPGFISLPNRCEHGVCFSKDGRECYLTVRAANWSAAEIMVTRYENGQWTVPVRASFSNTQSMCPSLADNDQSIYFSRSVDIWKASRTEQGWSQPQIVPAPVSSSQAEYSCHVSSLGNLWNCSWRPGGVGGCDQWRVQFSDGKFTQATDIRSLNTTANDCGPVPGPNEDYVIWNSNRAGGFGGVDLYISFSDGQGGWTEPRNMGPMINSSKTEAGPYLSPDHKYLFFSRDDTSTDSNIYWVRVEAFLPDPNGPVLNLSTGERFAIIQSAVNYAQSDQMIQVSPGIYHENLILPNKTLTIRSANALDSALVSLTILSGDGVSPVVTLMPGSALRSIQGLTIAGGVDGIVCAGARLQLSHCVVTGHRDCGIEVSDESTLVVEHCIVAGNAGPGLRSLPKTSGRSGPVFSTVDITCSTFVQNMQYAIDGDRINVTGSILYFNGVSSGNIEIKGSNVTVMFSDVQGGFEGNGNIDADPLFAALGTWADPNTYVLGDCHVKSQAGRWEPKIQTWIKDDMTSLCIDAGDPMSPIGLEPFPNGGIINMGAYGGTAEASKSYFGEPVCETIVAGDLNGDCKVNFADFQIITLHWLESGEDL